MKHLLHYLLGAALLTVPTLVTATSAAATAPQAASPVTRVSGIALSDGNVWLATQGGIVSLNATSGKSELYALSDAETEGPSKAFGNEFLSICVNGNEIWAGSKDAGVVRISGGKMQFFTLSYFNGAVISDGKGGVVVGNSSLNFYDGKAWTTTVIPSTLISSYAIIKALAYDKDGTLWYAGDNVSGDLFGSYAGGKVEPVKGIRDIEGMAIDAAGHKWLATRGSGVIEYGDKVVQSLTKANSAIASDHISAITVDAEGNIWFAAGASLYRYDGKAVSSTALPVKGNGFAVSSLAPDGSDLWIGTSEGLFKLSGGKVEAVDYTSQLKAAGNTEIILPKAEAAETWIGSPEGLIFVDKAGASHLIVAGNDTVNTITKIAVGKSGTAWAAVSHSDTVLIRSNGTDTQAFTTAGCPIAREGVSDIALDSQERLLAATTGGLLRFDGSSWENLSGAGSPIEGQAVKKVIADKADNIWLTIAGKGLYKYDGKSWTLYDKSNSALPYNNVTDIVADEKGTIWLTTSAGDGTNAGGGLTSISGDTWTTYNTSNSAIPSDNISNIMPYNNSILFLISGKGHVSAFNGTDTWASYDADVTGCDNHSLLSVAGEQCNNPVWLASIQSRGVTVARNVSDEITAIKKVTTTDVDSADKAVYDLSGLRVLHPVKGQVYISGGKKFIAR